MTLPVPIVEGFYFVTRRTHGGTFRLRPSRFTNELLRYLIAVAAVKYDVQVIAFCAMANHWHAVIYDKHANHRRFVQFVNALVARALNHRHKIRDTVWSGSRNPPVLLADADALVRKIVYVIANSVNSFLTDKASDWPGFVTLPKCLASYLPSLERPAGLFRLDGELPESARLRLYLPKCSGLSQILGGRVTADSFRTYIAQRVRQREKKLRAERREKRIKLPGREQLLEVSPFASPRELKFPVLSMTDEGKSRRIAPRVATRNVQLRTRLLHWFSEFLRTYQATREKWITRVGTDRYEMRGPPPLFPYGTNDLRTTLGVRCKPRPEDCPVPQLA